MASEDPPAPLPAPTPPEEPPWEPPHPGAGATSGGAEHPLGGALHPAAIVLSPIRQLTGLLVLLVGGAVAPGFDFSAPVGVVVAVVTVVGSLVRWARFRWAVVDGALVIDQGILERRRRVLPVERIQAVEVVRSLPHRLLGVVALRVEAIGGTEAEGRLDALDPAVAGRLRAVLLRHPPPSRPVTATSGALVEDAQPRGALLAALRRRDLVVAGLTGGRVGVAAALLGGAQQLLGRRIDDLVESLPLLGWQLGLLLALATVLLVFAISVVATALSWWRFELRRDGDALTVSRGLLEQREDTVPLGRLQALELRENAVRRALGLAAVRAVVAGRTGGEAASQTSVLLPLGRRDAAAALIEDVFGVAGLATAPVHAMPPGARGLRVGRALIVSAATGALAAGAAALVGTASPAGPAVTALVAGAGSAAFLVPLGVASYRGLGHGEHDGVLVARTGALGRATAFVPVQRVQSLAVTSTPFQRRRGLASLALHIPASAGASTPRWEDADAGWAAARLDGLARRVASGVG